MLHLHLVDSQSFPLVLPSAPRLASGAYSQSEKYTLEDLAGVQRHAAARGVRVVPEIDTPGHGAAWCAGMPEICPSARCREPLDPSTNATFDAIGAVLRDLATAFPDAYVHLGGDEVNTKCWNSTPHVAAWLREQHLTPDAAYGRFALRTQRIAQQVLRKQTIVWDEIWNHFGTALDRDMTIINTRFSPDQGPARPVAVANATRCAPPRPAPPRHPPTMPQARLPRRALPTPALVSRPDCPQAMDCPVSVRAVRSAQRRRVQPHRRRRRQHVGRDGGRLGPPAHNLAPCRGGGGAALGGQVPQFDSCRCPPLRGISLLPQSEGRSRGPGFQPHGEGSAKGARGLP